MDLPIVLEELPVGEATVWNNWDVIRVPGGWIFWDETKGTPGVFVPYYQEEY